MVMMFEELFSKFSNSDCGANLEYDSEFLNLNQLAQARPEQQFGETIIEAQGPDWFRVEKDAVSLCERTCDVRVLAILTAALTAQKGLVGYSEGLQLIEKSLEKFWDAIQPPVVEEDGYEDPIPRINALLALTDPQSMVPSLKQSQILSESYERLTLRDAEQIMEGNRSEDFPGGKVRLGQMLLQGRLSQDPLVLAIESASASLEAIRNVVTEKLGSEWAPDFSPVSVPLSSLMQLLSSASEESESTEESDSDENQSGQRLEDAGMSADSEASRAVSWRDMQIKTRADAILALEKASAYFEVYEPSHPAPFLIRRVQQTIPLNFYEILKNLTPNGHEQFDMWLPREE